MTKRHTPGPWVFAASNGDDCGMIFGKTGVVCDFVDDPKPANACLIAAAPELLDALIRLEQTAGIAAMSDETVRVNARAAIAKATGSVA